MKLRCLIIIPIILLWGILEARTISGKVVKVQDGDTVTVLVGKTQHKVRLDGIDCPELKQAYGQKARQFTAGMVFNRKVTVTYTKKDRYKRILGTVFTVNGVNLNKELLKNGLAWHYKQFNRDKSLAALENQARKARRGLWQDRSPIPPWQFRRAH